MPALAELVRQEQDLTKQVNAQLGTLNNVLALPAGQRDENGVKALNVAINNLRTSATSCAPTSPSAFRATPT